jgi:hypothetical protein
MSLFNFLFFTGQIKLFICSLTISPNFSGYCPVGYGLFIQDELHLLSHETKTTHKTLITKRCLSSSGRKQTQYLPAGQKKDPGAKAFGNYR